MVRIAVSAVSLGLVLTTIVGPARAKERDPEAGRHADEAAAHYEAGEFDKAIDAFRRAYAIDPDPRLLFNLARSTEKIGDAWRTVEAYESFLGTWPDAPNRKKIEAKIGAFRGEAAKTHRELSIESLPTAAEVRVGDALDLAGKTPLSHWFQHGPARVRVSRTGYLPEDRRLEVSPATPALQTFKLLAETSPANILVTGVPDGAEILIDGARMGLAPLTSAMQVHPGSRTVSVRAEGFLIRQQQLEVKPGGRETLEVTLVPAPPTPEPIATAPVEDSFEVPWTAWAAAGVSVAALTFGGVNILVALDDAAKARTESTITDDAGNPSGDRDRWQALKTSAEDSLLLSNVGFAVGGAGVVATGVLLWLANAD